jgi:predicted negative regulator of RcsB-dependent stress response
MTSWAVDLKDVGAIYPFQGTETLLVIIGLAFWIGWHVWQIRHENRELDAEVKRINAERAKKAIDRY